ncbi:STAS domain-containing protein [Amycolatopsis anabasis]|uniref:STAS domain-containing protein n=1 Tax=Amycolatopsis anabasis TaxID=1840409 RepID=UPI00131D4FC2|nr:STAS domain-containing protein [Amycolatopsis anabasis]
MTRPCTRTQPPFTRDSHPTAAPPFAVTVIHASAGYTHVVIEGDIDAISLPALDYELAAHPSGDTHAMVVDLSRVPFCSAGGLLTLTELLDRTTEAAVALELVVDTRAVRRALECLPVVGLFPIQHDRASALTATNTKVRTHARWPRRQLRPTSSR